MKFVEILLLSLVPTFEGRYAIIYGLAKGYPMLETLSASVLGVLILSITLPKLLPVIDVIMDKLKGTGLKPFADLYTSYLERTRKKAKPYVERWGFLGLMIFVAIPLPGTGIWTGALASYLLGISERASIPALLIGGLLSVMITAFPAIGYLKI
ncbi:COG2426 family protein [Pyrococcus horikoshii]|nr:COG2426 family protein [Pyrococcus horikoshii]HII60629.1 COG2426 family protein [Pyrococcus horikoshii]